MNEFSPNWYWNQLECKIVRYEKKRIIIDRFGREVCNDAGVMRELSIAKFLMGVDCDGTEA